MPPQDPNTPSQPEETHKKTDLDARVGDGSENDAPIDRARRSLAALDEVLATLDDLGLHLAAAHVDAALCQLRFDIARRADEARARKS